MKDYEYYFFDLDGTLTDPGIGITNSVMHALEYYNIRVKDRSEFFSFIGPPLVDSFMKYYRFSREEALKATDYYREYYSECGINENILYPEIPDTLEKLKSAGKKIILATSKPEPFAAIILDNFNLTKYFDFQAGALINETRTAKWEVIEYAINTLEIKDRGSILMVGDRMHDVSGAHKCGVDCMGVLYGYGNREELEQAGAEYIVERPEDIF